MPLTHFSNINNEVMDKINERYGSFDSFIDVKNKYIHFFNDFIKIFLYM